MPCQTILEAGPGCAKKQDVGSVFDVAVRVGGM